MKISAPDADLFTLLVSTDELYKLAHCMTEARVCIRNESQFADKIGASTSHVRGLIAELIDPLDGSAPYASQSKVTRVDDYNVKVNLTRSDLLVLRNCIRESISCLDYFEFQTRFGWEKGRVQTLFDQIDSVLA